MDAADCTLSVEAPSEIKYSFWKEDLDIVNTICLVKKDPNQPPSQENWVIMDGGQFYHFLSTEEGIRRKPNFLRLPAEDVTDANILIECDPTTLAEWKAELNRHDYLKRSQEETGYQCFSLYDTLKCDSGTMTWEEAIEDPDQPGVEDLVLVNLDKQSLREALKHLSQREYTVVFLLFLREPPLSTEECAKALGIARTTVYSIKEKSISKLRSLMT